MRVTSRSAVSRVAQSVSVATPGSVPVRVRSAAVARNRKGPAKRSFRGVCPRVFCCCRTVTYEKEKVTVTTVGTMVKTEK